MQPTHGLHNSGIREEEHESTPAPTRTLILAKIIPLRLQRPGHLRAGLAAISFSLASSAPKPLGGRAVVTGARGLSDVRLSRFFLCAP